MVSYGIFAAEVVFTNTDSDVSHEPSPTRTTIAVRAGERATVEIQDRLAGYSSISTTGQLRVEVAGLPAGTAASITVTGPTGYEADLVGSDVLRKLEPGTYTATAADVEAGGEFYFATVDPSPAEVEVEAVTQVNVVYEVAILTVTSQ